MDSKHQADEQEAEENKMADEQPDAKTDNTNAVGRGGEKEEEDDTGSDDNDRKRKSCDEDSSSGEDDDSDSEDSCDSEDLEKMENLMGLIKEERRKNQILTKAVVKIHQREQRSAKKRKMFGQIMALSASSSSDQKQQQQQQQEG